jgi:cytoskeletal protein CcmA (bactofilin family)
MLKRRNGKIKDSFEPTPVSIDPTPAPTPTFDMGTTDEKTVIGQHISVEGIIRGGENLVIEGSMKGTIELEKHQVTVGPNGQVEAEIHADNVTISGRLAGNIKAHGKVEITKDADFSGEIKAKRIAVEDGAYLKAVIELERGESKGTSGARPLGSSSPNKENPPPKAPLGSIKGT